MIIIYNMYSIELLLFNLNLQMDKGNSPMIQIAAFSTNDSKDTPIDIIDIYLKNNFQHSVPLNTKHTSTFTIVPFKSQNYYPNTKISICFITDLSKDYPQMKLAHSYLIFFDLENEESKDKLEQIFNYINRKCINDPKIYIFGMINNLKESVSAFSKKEIKDILTSLDDYSYLYEDLELASERKITKVIGRFLQDTTEIYYFGEKEPSEIEHISESNSQSCIII